MFGFRVLGQANLRPFTLSLEATNGLCRQQNPLGPLIRALRPLP